MKLKLFVVAFVIAIILGISWFGFLKSRTWWTFSGAEVWYDNVIDTDATVYTQGPNKFLLVFAQGQYFIDTSNESVSEPGYMPMLKLPGIVILRDDMQGGVSLQSAKIDRPHPIEFSRDEVRFFDLHQEKSVRVMLVGR